MWVVLEFPARSGGLQTADLCRAAIFAANVVGEVADSATDVACASSACLIGKMPMPHYRFSADSAVAAGFVFMARNAPTSRIAALQS